MVGDETFYGMEPHERLAFQSFLHQQGDSKYLERFLNSEQGKRLIEAIKTGDRVGIYQNWKVPEDTGNRKDREMYVSVR